MRSLPATTARRQGWMRALLAMAVTTAMVGEAPPASAAGGSIGGSIGGGGSGGSSGGSIGGGTGGGGSGGGSMGGDIAPSHPRREAAPPPRESAARREPARRSRRAARYEPAKRESEGGGGGGGGGGREARGSGASFDGVWAVSTNSSCGKSGSSTMRISHGRLFVRAAYGSTSGSVSPSGAIHTVGHYSGLTQTSSGRLSGSSGSGTFRDSNGCSGTWTASR